MSQSWPPTGDYRTHPRISTPLVVLLILLALVLIGGGLGFIVYSANTEYHHALSTDATVVVQSTHNVFATTQAQSQATVNVVNTALARVEATNTAVANDNANATATVDSVTATVSAFADLYSQTSTGTPALDDPLTDNKGDGKWEGSNQDAGAIHLAPTGCAFGGDGYHVSEAQQGNFQPCFAQVGIFGNMAYQVAMTFLKGSQAQGGVLLRADGSRKSYYFFRISVDGSYALDLYTSSQASTLTSGFSAAINEGLKQSNQIAVIAKGQHFYLYVNSQYVDDVSDGTLTSGGIGVAVVDASVPVDAIVSHAQVWKI